MKLTVGVVLAAVASVATPAGALAQACLGNLAPAGHAYVAGSVGFTSNIWMLDGTLGDNLASPLAVQGDVGYASYSGGGSSVGISGTAAYKLASKEFSACPVGQLGYVGFSNGGGHDLVYAAGLAVGFPNTSRSGLAWAPFASALLTGDRSSVDVGAVTFSHTSTYVNLDAGIALGRNRLYGRADIGIATLSGSSAVLTLGVGYTL